MNSPAIKPVALAHAIPEMAGILAAFEILMKTNLC
jgi:hypothetical protein